MLVLSLYHMRAYGSRHWFSHSPPSFFIKILLLLKQKTWEWNMVWCGNTHIIVIPFNTCRGVALQDGLYLRVLRTTTYMAASVGRHIEIMVFYLHCNIKHALVSSSQHCSSLYFKEQSWSDEQSWAVRLCLTSCQREGFWVVLYTSQTLSASYTLYFNSKGWSNRPITSFN